MCRLADVYKLQTRKIFSIRFSKETYAFANCFDQTFYFLKIPKHSMMQFSNFHVKPIANRTYKAK